MTSSRPINPAARVAVLTGTGRAFCSGQDLGDRVNATLVVDSGTVGGNGVAAVLLKRYDRAVADGDTVTILPAVAGGAGDVVALAAANTVSG